MPERDDGQDKTDYKEDARIAKKALEEMNAMPFFRVGVPRIPFFKE
jgi:hypothetical protein